MPDTYADPYSTGWARAILLGLQHKHVYMGTVPDNEILRRRVKNRAARKARKINRVRRAA
ncbi:hypothetical protein ACFRAQ_36215 [Nocardia sp. NPDC056611]|uniref:hypothetical protein n=1 Tax=Nocardia sp. NPDC056611 TaxID=3345877 RepID=UPI0036713C87